MDCIRVKPDELQLFAGPMIRVDVGPDRKAFFVHEQLLRNVSRFFDAVTRNDWKESTERVVPLPVDDPDVFSLFVGWLYNCKFSTKNDVGGAEGNREYVMLAKLYVLGDKLQATGFKHSVIDAILGKTVAPLQPTNHHWHPLGSVIRYLYESTPPASPARCLLVDLYVYHGQGNWLTTHATDEDVTRDFLLDLSVALRDGRSRSDSAIDPKELAKSGQYHE
ncbi:hypothetical protein H2201_008747 [Coniosporium apollinis]|uniref:BTB domain-containing protein n=1 Tax=Coniosporium apollinis TaxID=61459 RepID=A0ABQ9NIX2_9PEZI|nr:hypothetical protein H2201_008747 [Coniosporium apollinis]